MPTYRAPEFRSDATEFHVILWNLNYGNDAVKDGIDGVKETEQFPKEFTNEFPKEGKRFPKEEKQFPKEFRKEFLSAQRGIYKLISSNPHITIVGMAKELGVSDRQIKKYLQRLTELKLIERQGGRKNGLWKITDEDYEKIFEQQ